MPPAAEREGTPSCADPLAISLLTLSFRHHYLAASGEASFIAKGVIPMTKFSHSILYSLKQFYILCCINSIHNFAALTNLNAV